MPAAGYDAPTGQSTPEAPYLFLSEESGAMMPTFWVRNDPEGMLTAWPASHFDLLATDWEDAT